MTFTLDKSGSSKVQSSKGEHQQLLAEASLAKETAQKPQMDKLKAMQT